MEADEEGNTLLHKVASSAKAHLDVVDFLLEKGLNINAQNSRGSSALHVAAERENLAACEMLVAKVVHRTFLR